MRATRTLLTAVLLGAAALAAPAAAAPGCGPYYQEVESLRISVSEPVVRHGVAEVSVHVTRVGNPTRLGVEGTHLAVGRVVNGTARFGRAVTGAQGVAVVRLDRRSPSTNWRQRATAAKETMAAEGCAPGVIETGLLVG